MKNTNKILIALVIVLSFGLVTYSLMMKKEKVTEITHTHDGHAHSHKEELKECQTTECKNEKISHPEVKNEKISVKKDVKPTKHTTEKKVTVKKKQSK
jgi:hypothetical protein